MEAAFVDIGTPKNGVLYRGDVAFDEADVEGGSKPKIERMLKNGQIDHRAGHEEPDRAQGRAPHPGGQPRRPLRGDGAGPARRPTASRSACPTTSASACARCSTASARPTPGSSCAPRPRARPPTSSSATSRRLRDQWEQISALAARVEAGASCCTRSRRSWCGCIREEFTKEYRGVVIDDRALYEEVKAYVEAIAPELAERIEFYDESRGPADLRAVPRPRAAAEGARPQGLAAVGRLAHHRAHRGAHRHRREHGQERRQVEPRGDRLPATTSRRPTRSPASSASATSAGSSSSTSSTWRSGRTATRPCEGVPGRPGPGQDPDPGLRDLRARPGRDDPQADLGGPGRGVLARPAPSATAGASSSTRRCCRLEDLA